MATRLIDFKKMFTCCKESSVYCLYLRTGVEERNADPKLSGTALFEASGLPLEVAFPGFAALPLGEGALRFSWVLAASWLRKSGIGSFGSAGLFAPDLAFPCIGLVIGGGTRGRLRASWRLEGRIGGGSRDGTSLGDSLDLVWVSDPFELELIFLFFLLNLESSLGLVKK